jgi:hypothetical protein
VRSSRRRRACCGGEPVSFAAVVAVGLLYTGMTVAGYMVVQTLFMWPIGCKVLA